MTLNSLIDSVSNPTGHFTTLRDIYPVRNSQGMPVMFVRRLAVDFCVIWRGAEYSLRCFLPGGDNLRERARQTAGKMPLVGRDPEFAFFCEELATVDSAGGSALHDVSLRRMPFAAAPLDKPVHRVVVAGSGGDMLTDMSGGQVMPPVYDEIVWDPDAGLAAACLDGMWALFDGNGEKLTGHTYEWIGIMCEERILAQRDGKMGFLDREGREAVEFAYDSASSFAGCVSPVTQDGQEFLINRFGVRVG